MSGGTGGGGGGDGSLGGGTTIRWVPVIWSRVTAVLTSCTFCAGIDAGVAIAAIGARAGAAAIIMRVGAPAAGVATRATEPASAGWNAMKGGRPTTGPQRTGTEAGGRGGGAGGGTGGLDGGGAAAIV